MLFVPTFEPAFEVPCCDHSFWLSWRLEVFDAYFVSKFKHWDFHIIWNFGVWNCNRTSVNNSWFGVGGWHDWPRDEDPDWLWVAGKPTCQAWGNPSNDIRYKEMIFSSVTRRAHKLLVYWKNLISGLAVFPEQHQNCTVKIRVTSKHGMTLLSKSIVISTTATTAKIQARFIFEYCGYMYGTDSLISRILERVRSYEC